VVRDATEKYLAAEDHVGRWIEDNCVIDARCWAASKSLFADWRAWCQENGVSEGSQKRFARNLEAHGCEFRRTREARGFAGIGLKTDVVTDVTDHPILDVCVRPRA
jgi:putative DNA primase/helicase